ncbi:cytochrome P450 [Mycena vulgaris]|nr:cytochrome P450 [Mycena vulgaris]
MTERMLSVDSKHVSETWTMIILILAPTLVFLLYYRHSKKKPFPPGPTGIPILGCALKLVTEDVWLVFAKWRREFGPTFFFTANGQSFVVLNTATSAADLLQRRATLYSDRPFNYVARTLLSGDLQIAFAPYSDQWRRLRRATHEGLKQSRTPVFHPIQEREALVLARSILLEPDNWFSHMTRTAASTIMSIAYGLPPLVDNDDPAIHAVRAYTDRLAKAVSPGAYLVELLPWMRHLPIWAATWKRESMRHFKEDSITFEGLYREALTRLSMGSAESSLAGILHNGSSQKKLSEKERAWLCGTLFSAGAETTSGTLCWFIAAMVLYPDVQTRAQLEIDNIIGRHRLPTYADRMNLPYIVATVRETLRWRPVLPLGLPHASLQDDVYEDRFIPKGTTCIQNIWEINHDRNVFGQDAAEYNPERYLNEQGLLVPPFTDTQGEGHATYGSGERICQGRHLANDTLFIDIATILWSFQISPGTSDNGQPCLPDAYAHPKTGMTLHPLPFQCSISARSPEVYAVLMETQR